MFTQTESLRSFRTRPILRDRRLPAANGNAAFLPPSANGWTALWCVSQWQGSAAVTMLQLDCSLELLPHSSLHERMGSMCAESCGCSSEPNTPSFTCCSSHAHTSTWPHFTQRQRGTHTFYILHPTQPEHAAVCATLTNQQTSQKHNDCSSIKYYNKADFKSSGSCVVTRNTELTSKHLTDKLRTKILCSLFSLRLCWDQSQLHPDV